MRCKIHIDREASGACMYCGNLFCDDCLVDLNGKKYCKDHISNVINDMKSNTSINEINSKNNSTPKNSVQNSVKYAPPKSWTKPIIIGVSIAMVIIGIFLAVRFTYSESCKNIVKQGHLSQYTNANLKDAYENFFGKPKWDYFSSEEDKDIVEFTGLCNWKGKETLATIQFTVNKTNKTFEVTYFAFDNTTQNMAIFDGTMDKIYQVYNNKSSQIDKDIQTVINNDNGQTMKNIANGINERLVEEGYLNEANVIKNDTNKSSNNEQNTNTNVTSNSTSTHTEADLYTELSFPSGYDLPTQVSDEVLINAVKNSSFDNFSKDASSIGGSFGSYFQNPRFIIETIQSDTPFYDLAFTGTTNKGLVKIVFNCNVMRKELTISKVSINGAELSNNQIISLFEDIYK